MLSSLHMQNLCHDNWSEFKLDFKSDFSVKQDWLSLEPENLTYIASCKAAVNLSLLEDGCALTIFDLKVSEGILNYKYCLKFSSPVKDALLLFLDAICIRSFKARDVIDFLSDSIKSDLSVDINNIDVCKEEIKFNELFNPFITPSSALLILPELNTDKIFKG